MNLHKRAGADLESARGNPARAARILAYARPDQGQVSAKTALSEDLLSQLVLATPAIRFDSLTDCRRLPSIFSIWRR